MKSEIENITNQALNLSPSARAYLAEILLESLDLEEDFPISLEWLNEIHRRCKEIDHGAVELIDGESAMTQIRNKYEAL